MITPSMSFDMTEGSQADVDMPDRDNNTLPITTIGEYSIQSQIAEGAFGRVLKARDRYHNPVVLKKIPKSRLKKGEVLAGQLLPNHPNIIKLHKYFEDSCNAYLVFDFIDGDDMFTIMEKRGFHPLRENFARAVFRGLAKAVYQAHMCGIAHRDLKLENIMLDKSNKKIILIDFGLCDIVGGGLNGSLESESTGCVGSPEYMAPELLTGAPYSAKRADMWSLGVVLFFLLTGNFPLDMNQRIKDILEHRNPEPFQLEFPPEFQLLSESLRDLLRHMLVDNPEGRLTISQVMTHPWLQKTPSTTTSPMSSAPSSPVATRLLPPHHHQSEDCSTHQLNVAATINAYSNIHAFCAARELLLGE